ncbi:disease resistance protein At4g27190-like [Magnolia sinica]|uniref:disease resistance protein At4g27190-like n=1 Tax=Magnolia sinica TaxID=86752 RepID=UPI00265987CE|nr:disease resistance protein At4g27190-like [Magnolia sinica]
MEAALLAVVGKCAWNPLKKHMGYLIHFNDNVKDMKDRVQELVARRGDIDRLVSTGCSNGEEIIGEVSLWLIRAADMKEESETIEQRVAENKRCLFCPNLSWRYRISKHAKQTMENMVKHHNEGNFERVTMPPLIPKVINQPAPSIDGLPSMESYLVQVMNALGDENIKIIGVWGMGGVGKTTLVKIMKNRLEGTKQFNKVIMMTASKDVDIRRIQGDIAKRLGFTLRDEAESSRASDLRNRLMNEKKFLIILDDLWERLDLADVGIPLTNELGACKIIFTTRCEDACRGMESQVNIKVDVLSDDESWKLFKEKAGDVVDDASLHAKAREVFKECGGLPLAIITLGRALRGVRNPNVWDNALSQLKMSMPRDIKGMEDKVYQSIKVTYDHLRPELKPGFLFCCLFPEDYDIHVDRMIRLWKGEGFLENVGSLDETINKGHSWIEELKSSCLLLEGRIEGYVKMHDIVRDVAISISLKEDEGCKSLVRSGVKLKGMPQGQNWKEYKRISLMRSGIHKLPEGLQCPKLLTMMMPENKELTEIQGWFFEATKDLRVLDIRETTISRLPPSLSKLVNLRVLCLRECMFDGSYLSALGGLKQLESLDLSYNSNLCKLPTEIGELINLQSLDLTETRSLVMISSGVISRLTHLEELKMWNSFCEWEIEEEDSGSSISNKNKNATLGEVASLKELSYLDIWIGDVERFPQDYPQIKHWAKLKNFRFYLYPSGHEGIVFDYYPGFIHGSLRWMKLVGCNAIPGWVRILLPHTTILELLDCKGLRALGGRGGFPSLEYLEIWECVDMEFVLSAKESNTFRNLQRLRLENLPNLYKVVSVDEEGLLPTTFLDNLRNLQAYKCHGLKHLLPTCLLQGMDNLTEVEVWSCEAMEHVFAGPPMTVQYHHVLTKLETLYLQDLTSMTSIWAMGLVVKLQNLTTLTLWWCHGLKKTILTSAQMKDGLPNLANLSVGYCKGVEEIISDVVDKEGLLPKLRVLRLHALPELMHICGGEAATLLQLDWHSLEEIEVDRCPNLKKLLPLQGGAHSAPLLRKIKGEIEWWEALDWEGDDTVLSHFHPLFIEF